MSRAAPSCRHVSNAVPRTKSGTALFRVAVMTIASLMLLAFLSAPVGTPQVVLEEPTPVEGTFAEASNFIRVSLPYPVYSIAVGNTSQGPGFAYVHDELLRFRNPVTLVNDSVPLGPETVIHETLTGADMDGDSHTEFLVMRFSVIDTYCSVVDFDTHSRTDYPCLVADPTEILTGDFDGNGGVDIAIYNRDSLLIINTTDSSVMGTYDFSPNYVMHACVGDFLTDAGDEIAVLFMLYPNAFIRVINVEETFPTTETILMADPCDIITFQHDAGLEDIAFSYLNLGTGTQGSLRVYSTNAIGGLNEIFTADSPCATGLPFLGTGHFDDDLQEDIVVLGKSRAQAWFVNGFDGSTIRTSVEECNRANWGTFATAVLDSDSYTDVAVEGPRGQLSLIRGVNGETGYEEPRSPGPFTQVMTYDLDSDGRDDILALTDIVTILLSDIQPPSVALEPLYPAHPTFYDTYIKIELSATDNLEVRSAVLFIRPAGGATIGMYQQQQMVRTPTGKYVFIMAGLQPSDFEYYIEVTDPYLNMYSYRNETDPELLTVEGHFAWGHFFNTTIDQGQTHALAMGNDSAGGQRILTMTVEPSLGTATVRAFSPNGTEVAQTEVLSMSAHFSFEVYSGMFDGDDILDPVAVGYNTTHILFWIIHGNNMTIWSSHTRNIPSTTARNGLLVFDDDQDLTDEIHYMGYDGLLYLLNRADEGFTWTKTTLIGNKSVIGAAEAMLYAPRPQIGILRDGNKIDIHQAYNGTWIKTMNYSSPGSTLNDFAYAIRAYHNGSRPTDQFLAVYGGWDVDTPVTYFCFIDSETSEVGDAPSYTLSGCHAQSGALYDTDADSIDELLVFDSMGNVSLLDMSYVEVIRWTTSVSEAGPLSSALLDYDGDGTDEFLLSTSDDMLTAITLNGVIDYQATVGMLFNMVDIGNVDSGPGEDIMAFPILRAQNTLGAVRDIELFYVLNVSLDLETGVILQGTNLWANTTVLNVFNEPVSDAFVSLTAVYRFGSGTAEQSFGSVYDNISLQYSSTITPNWPMGMVNISLAVTHEYYDSYYDAFTNILRVVSPLSINVFLEPEVAQGGNLPVNVSVTDSLGVRVTDADVNVTLGGIVYPASYNGEFYHVVVTGITLTLGVHTLVASADHPYSTGMANRPASYAVMTSTLVIVRNSPALVEQDEYFVIELSITDQYGNPLDGADVVIDFGVTEFFMSQVGAGIYQLNDTAAMPIGNYTCEIVVSHDFVTGNVFGSFYIGVMGDLSPVVSYEGTVEAGTSFNISVFVYDQYGTVPDGANVTIDVGGTLYQADFIGGAEFRVTALANFSIGEKNFTVYVGAIFGHPWSEDSWVTVMSVPYTELSSSLGWVLDQGLSSLIKLQLRDWSGSPVTGATVITLSPGSLAFSDLNNGTYTVMLSTVGYGPDSYDLIVLVTHTHLSSAQLTEGLAIIGPAVIIMAASDPFLNYVEQTFNFTITDQYGNPLSNFSYSGNFSDAFNTSGISPTYRFIWTLFPSLTPGQHILNLTVTGTYLVRTTRTWQIAVISVPATELSSSMGWVIDQGLSSQIKLQLRDWYGSLVAGATIVTTTPENLVFLDQNNGTYVVTLATAGYAPGLYYLTVSVTHSYLNSTQLTEDFAIVGPAIITMDASGNFLNNEDQTFNFTITDQYGNPLSDFSYSAIFAGVFTTSGTSSTYRFSWTLSPNVPPGNRPLNLTITGTYLVRTSIAWIITVRSEGLVTIVAPSLQESYVQGDDQILYRIDVTDSLGNHMLGCSVSILIQQTEYLLQDRGNGTYTVLVATSGWAPGNYSYRMFLTHSLLDYNEQVSRSVTIIGRLNLDITLSTSMPEQNSTVIVTVRVADSYAHSMTGATVMLTFAGRTIPVPETSSPGVYETELAIEFVSHGQRDIVISAEHLLCIQANTTLSVEVTVRAPQISMSAETFVLGSGVSFLVSLIGLLIYFKLSSSLAVVDVTSKGTVRSIRRMDMLYVGIVGLGGLTLLHSFASAQAGDFGLALAESVLLLGISVLLYGIWLYRDANYALIRAKSISKKRMILGLWHLVFVPLVIVQIFAWGEPIEWFQFFVLESRFYLGPIGIPTIMLTIFATYTSSIGIVVVNLYREIRNSLLRLDRMAAAGTPPAVVAEERMHLVAKMGSSIRIKFFMFLVIIAGTTIMSIPALLSSYSLGVIVLIPVLFLVVIPYVSSKMLRGASKVSGKMRDRRPSSSPSLTQVADTVTVVSERPKDESYSVPDKSVPTEDTEWKPEKDSDEEI